MKRIFFYLLAILFVFTSCEKAELLNTGADVQLLTKTEQKQSDKEQDGQFKDGFAQMVSEATGEVLPFRVDVSWEMQQNWGLTGTILTFEYNQCMLDEDSNLLDFETSRVSWQITNLHSGVVSNSPTPIKEVDVPSITQDSFSSYIAYNRNYVIDLYVEGVWDGVDVAYDVDFCIYIDMPQRIRDGVEPEAAIQIDCLDNTLLANCGGPHGGNYVALAP